MINQSSTAMRPLRRMRFISATAARPGMAGCTVKLYYQQTCAIAIQRFIWSHFSLLSASADLVGVSYTFEDPP